MSSGDERDRPLGGRVGDERERVLAERLRDNLKRRKAQARARRAAADTDEAAGPRETGAGGDGKADP